MIWLEVSTLNCIRKILQKVTNLGDSEIKKFSLLYFLRNNFICHNFVTTKLITIQFVGNEEHIYLPTYNIKSTICYDQFGGF